MYVCTDGLLRSICKTPASRQHAAMCYAKVNGCCCCWPLLSAVKRTGGSKEQGALTVRDVALLLRQPEEEGTADEELPDTTQQAQQAQQEQQEQQEQLGRARGRGPAAAGAVVSPRERAAAAAAARAAAAAAAAAAAGGTP